MIYRVHVLNNYLQGGIIKVMGHDSLVSTEHYAEKPEQYFSIDRSEMLKFIPKGASRVLEVGCGQGGFGALIAATMGAEVHGVEINREAASIASSALKRVFVGPMEDVIDQLPDDFYDTVVFNDVLEHFSYPEKVLQSLRKKVVQGGVIVASIPNVRHIGNLYHLLVEKDWHYLDSGIRDRTHLRFFTEKSIRRFFYENGFKIRSLQGICPSKNLLVTLINWVTLGYFNDVRYFQFAVVAEFPLNFTPNCR